jgi:hypothetical protein
MKTNIAKKIVTLKTAAVAAFITILSITGTNLTATAADTENNYAIWGEGGASCFRYSKARTEKKDSAFKSYIRGYLTAFNTLSNDTYNITGAMTLPEIMEWMDDYCGEKAIDSVDRAIQGLIDDVEDNRQKKPVKKGISEGWGDQ